MIINGMEEFQGICREKLVKWYNQQHSLENGTKWIPKQEIKFENTFVVWSCKTLQNYKLLASTDVDGDGVYAEYTFNGDKGELYEDVYIKMTNTAYTED